MSCPKLQLNSTTELLRGCADRELFRFEELYARLNLEVLLVVLCRVNCNTAAVRSGWMSPRRLGMSENFLESSLLPGDRRSSWCRLWRTAVRGEGEAASRSTIERSAECTMAEAAS
jgi:hypothetical protein